MDGSPIQAWQPIKVECFQCLLATEVGAAQAQAQFLVVASSDLIVDQQREKLGEGQLAIDGLTVSRFQRIEDAR
ncbi:hypothetical protein R75465_08651 [Paraburkholderia aspalathi]|nr:hypothetical protein R75465_08651 [Paraburkholderia aspalathi]